MGGSERGVGGASSMRFAADEILLFDLAGVIFGHTIGGRVSVMAGRSRPLSASIRSWHLARECHEEDGTFYRDYSDNWKDGGPPS
jgi:hypothetical protein